MIGPHFPVHLHAPLHADLDALLVGKGVLETIAKDDGDGEALALFVRSGGGLGGPDAAHFAEVPVVGGIDSFEMFLGSAWHDEICSGTLSGTMWKIKMCLYRAGEREDEFRSIAY